MTRRSAANEQLNWRVTEIVANFEERQGRSEQAQALYDRFIRENSSSDLATAVAGDPRRRSAEAADRFAFGRARRGAVRSRQRAEPARDDRSGAAVRPRRAGAAPAIPAGATAALRYPERPEQARGKPRGTERNPEGLAVLLVGAAARRGQSRHARSHRRGDRAAQGDGGGKPELDRRPRHARRHPARQETLRRGGRCL